MRYYPSLSLFSTTLLLDNNNLTSAYLLGGSIPSPTNGAKLRAEWISTQTNIETKGFGKRNSGKKSGGGSTAPALPFPPRSGHVAFHHEDTDRLFLFGGYAEEFVENRKDGGTTMKRYATNDMWEGRRQQANDDDGDAIGSYVWNKVEQKGDVPEERLVAASAVLNGRSYLFGGWNPQQQGTGGTILDTIHSFDPSTKSWTQLRQTIPDGPTSRHVALALPCNTKAVLHNHRCDDNFVYVFDSETETMERRYTFGEAPSSRGLHSACMLGSFVCLFGGAAKDGLMSDEVFLLNTITWEWTKVRFEEGGDVPVGRAGSTMVSFNETCAILYGGAAPSERGLKALGDVWTLNINRFGGTGKWECLLDEKDCERKYGPPARNAATLSEIPMNGSVKRLSGKSFLLSGGWAPFQKTHSDSFVLTVM